MKYKMTAYSRKTKGRDKITIHKNGSISFPKFFLVKNNLLEQNYVQFYYSIEEEQIGLVFSIIKLADSFTLTKPGYSIASQNAMLQTEFKFKSGDYPYRKKETKEGTFYLISL